MRTGRPRNFHNGPYEKLRASRLLKDFYQRTFGETISAVRVKESGAVRKPNGFLYFYDRSEWQSGLKVVRLAQIKRDSKYFLVGFDVILDGQGSGKDTLVSLIEFGKKCGTPIAFHGMGRPFEVTRHWTISPA